MLSKSEVEEYISSLSPRTQNIIEKMAQAEIWPVDDEPDLTPLVDVAGKKLASLPESAIHQQLHLLLGNSARFNLKRFLKLLQHLSQINPEFVAQIISPYVAGRIEDGDVYAHTVMTRLTHIIRTELIHELFDPELISLINTALTTDENEFSFTKQSLETVKETPAEITIKEPDGEQGQATIKGVNPLYQRISKDINAKKESSE